MVIRCLLTLVLLSSQLATAQASSDEQSRTIFHKYIRAMNHHDVDGYMSLLSDDFAFIQRDGTPLADARAVMRRYRLWEAEMKTHFDAKVVRSEQDKLLAEVVEHNLLNQALGVRRVQTVQYTFADGKVKQITGISVKDEGADQKAAMAALQDWLSHKPADQTGLLESGQLLYTPEAARKLRPLLREWKNSHAMNAAVSAARSSKFHVLPFHGHETRN